MPDPSPSLKERTDVHYKWLPDGRLLIRPDVPTASHSIYQGLLALGLEPQDILKHEVARGNERVIEYFSLTANGVKSFVGPLTRAPGEAPVTHFTPDPTAVDRHTHYAAARQKHAQSYKLRQNGKKSAEDPKTAIER